LLKKMEEPLSLAEKKAIPELHTMTRWDAVLERRTRQRLEEEILPAYLPGCRWFGGKAKVIRSISIVENIPLGEDSDLSRLLLLEVRYTEGAPDLYLLPLCFSLTRRGEQGGEELMVEGRRVRLDYEWLTIKAKMIMEEFSQSILARLVVDGDEGILHDAVYDGKCREALLAAIAHRKRIKGQGGTLVGLPGRRFRNLVGSKTLPLNSQPLKVEQSNTSILYEDTFYFKLFRGLKEGINPDQEISQFLTEKARFAHTPPFAGCLEYRQPGAEPITVGLLHGLTPNQGDAWAFTLDAAGRYFEQVLSSAGEIEKVPKTSAGLLAIDLDSMTSMREFVEGHFLEMVALLGRRTGEMHLSLSSLPEQREFAPEPFSLLYQRSLFQSMRALLRRVISDLKNNLRNLPAAMQEEASWVLGAEPKILGRLEKILDHKLAAARIRIHGDYHLGQVLYTGKDFVIIDFEGEPARTLSERRLKRSPLRDVSGMLRSFHYAAYSALLKEAPLRPDDIPALEPWTDLWYQYVSAVYLHSYLETVAKAPLLPGKKEDLEMMLKIFLLEKAVYELGYELNHRPDWVVIPIRGIKSLLAEE
jgi:maltose alpha-D-glucosyltransferase/alpha-amylase